MNVILTSDIMSPDKRQLNSQNGFVDKIQEYVGDINCLYILSTSTISNTHDKLALQESLQKKWIHSQTLDNFVSF